MTAETKVAKNKLGGAVAPPPTKEKPKTIFDVIKAGEKNFAAALPKHINSERFVRIALTQIRINPELARCSQDSLLGALMTLAQLGLEPGVLGQAYLIPFNNKKLGTTECQLQLSYKGMIELLRRTKQLKDIYAYPVYSNDEFEIIYGLQRDLVHKPNFKEGRGEIVGFYSVAILVDETRAFEYMTKSEVISHEEKYRKGSYKNSIWDKNFEEMALKTVTKKMLKWLPISVEMVENLRKEDNVQKFNEATQELTEDVSEVEVMEAETVDVEKASKEDLLTLLESATFTGMDMKKIASENGYDLENLSVDELDFLQNIVDEKINEKM